MSGAPITGPHCHQGPSVGWSPLAPRTPCLQGRSPSFPSGPHMRKSSAPRPRTAGRPPGRGAAAHEVSLVPSSPPAEGGGAVLLRGLWALEDPACGHPCCPRCGTQTPFIAKVRGASKVSEAERREVPGTAGTPQGGPRPVWQPGVLEQCCDEARAVPCELGSHPSARSSAGGRPSPPGASGRGCVRVPVATGVWGLRTRPCGGTGQAGLAEAQEGLLCLGCGCDVGWTSFTNLKGPWRMLREQLWDQDTGHTHTCRPHPHPSDTLPDAGHILCLRCRGCFLELCRDPPGP